MADVVIDASVTLAWLFGEDEQTPTIDTRIGDATWIAPALWRLEVVNAVLIRERRQQITPTQGTRFLQVLESLQINVVGEPTGRSLEQLALLARPHQLSAYDAVYLELAIALGLPLWSYDRNLQEAAKRIGVALIEDASV